MLRGREEVKNVMARGVGRPPTKIDKKDFEALCGIQCTLFEIASFFGCTRQIIERWCKREYRRPFKEVFAEKRGRGRISLRRIQWQLAEKSTAMAIFLGKNYLGQNDRQNMEVSGPNGKPVEVTQKLDYSMLSMSELKTLDAICAKMESANNGNDNDDDNTGPSEQERHTGED